MARWGGRLARGRDGGDGWQSTWAGMEGWGKPARLVGRRAPRVISYVDERAGALDSRPLRRSWNGVADASIAQNRADAWCEPKNHADPQIAIGTAIKGADGDSLRNVS